MPEWISVRTPHGSSVVTSRAPFDASTTEALVRAARSVRAPGTDPNARFSLYVVLLTFAPGDHGLYVGMTGLEPDQRYRNHKAGHKASRWVKRYGVGLLPALYSHVGPLTYETALELEVALAEALRRTGVRVEQAYGALAIRAVLRMVCA